MQQAMTRWIEMADARAACLEAAAQQTPADAPRSEAPGRFAEVLRLEALLQPMSRCFGLGQSRPQA